MPGGVAGTDLEKIQRGKVTVERSNLHVVGLPLALYGLEEARVRLLPSGEFKL